MLNRISLKYFRQNQKEAAGVRGNRLGSAAISVAFPTERGPGDRELLFEQDAHYRARMPRPHIAVLGLFAADLTSRVPRLPHWHETLEGLGATLGAGGKASNQAIAAARLGAAASFIGKVGADPFGDMAKRLYDREGVDRTHLATSASEATGTALILTTRAAITPSWSTVGPPRR